MRSSLPVRVLRIRMHNSALVNAAVCSNIFISYSTNQYWYFFRGSSATGQPYARIHQQMVINHVLETWIDSMVFFFMSIDTKHVPVYLSFLFLFFFCFFKFGTRTLLLVHKKKCKINICAFVGRRAVHHSKLACGERVNGLYNDREITCNVNMKTKGIDLGGRALARARAFMHTSLIAISINAVCLRTCEFYLPPSIYLVIYSMDEWPHAHIYI